MSDGFGGTDTFTDINGAWIRGFGSDILIGDDSDNRFVLTGGGEDVLEGGRGDDSFLIDGPVASIDGGEGTDFLRFWGAADRLNADGFIIRIDRDAGVSIDLDEGIYRDLSFGGETQVSRIENLQGTRFDDTLLGDDNNNYLDGQGGYDRLEGRGGDDLLVLQDGGEADGGAGDDRLFARSSSETAFLRGGDGNDDLDGGFAADELYGGSGDDELNGGAGADLLAGGLGADKFLYWREDGRIFDNDTIVDFDDEDAVTIIRSSIPPEEIDFIGTSEFSGVAFQIRYEVQDGDTVILEDSDGDGQADASVTLKGYTGGLRTAIGEFGHLELRANSAPVANDDSSETDVDSGVSIFVFGNDNDPDGDALSIVSFAQAERGLVLDQGEGGFRYVPEAGFIGTDTFTYTVTDGELTSTATVSIEVAEPGPSIILGSEFDDFLIGTSRDDTIQTFGGSDIAYGNEGNDLIEGGAGLDFLYGDEGDDELRGGEGNDFLRPGLGNDIADGGPGFDMVLYTPLEISSLFVDLVAGSATYTDANGQQFSDQLISIERVSGSNHDDQISGDDEDNDLFGEFGNDILFGRGAVDWLYGDAGDDRLDGGDGDDRLFAGIGDDILIGGLGDDEYILGVGADIVVLETGGGKDFIAFVENNPLSSGDAEERFNPSEDRIDVSALGLTATQALGLAQQVDSSVVLDFGNGDSLEIRNTTATALTEANFIGVEPPPPEPEFNLIDASAGQENLFGTEAADAFIFAPGTSVNGAIDTVLDWAPGDVIDLSALGLTSEDIEVRTISGGTVIKLIEGFGEGEFHVKINLNGYSQEDVLASVIYDGETPPEQTVPMANDDIVRTELNSVVAVSVLSNDTDPNDASLFIAEFTQPTNGVLVYVGNGVFQYTPDIGFVGSDSFNYTVSNGAATNQASVDLTVIETVERNLIVGSDDTELIGGTDLADEIQGLDGDDTLQGFAGDDLLIGGLGRDRLYGGAGDDIVIGGGSELSAFGDFFYADPGNDLLIGSPDTIDMYRVSSLINPVHVDLSAETVFADGHGGVDIIRDIERVHLRSPTDDIIIGNDADNTFTILGGGADVIQGHAGSDVFFIELAPSSIDGGEGSDGVYFLETIPITENGPLSLSSTSRSTGVHVDLAIGEIVDDGYGGQAPITSIERIIGTDFDDRLIGDGKDNYLDAEDGNDIVQGGEGNDTIAGDLGNKFFDGGAGDDYILIRDGDGESLIIGGTGADYIYIGGGTGQQTLVIRPGDGADIVNGFNPEHDRLNVSELGLTSAQALALVSNTTGFVYVDFGNGDTLELSGISAGDLTEANFIGVATSPEPPQEEEFNVIEAGIGQENLFGTDAADAFTFAPGTSVNGAIDTVFDWAPGDIIDLSALGLTSDDLEVRSISGGTVIKLIEGFGTGEFHVKINLNGFNQEEVLASVIYIAEADVVESLALSVASKTSLSEPLSPIKQFDDAGAEIIETTSVMTPIKDFEMETASVSSLVSEMFEPVSNDVSPVTDWFVDMTDQGVIGDNTIILPSFVSSDLTDGFGDIDSILTSSEWDFA
ncbi:MAG: Ig-like domain-containing protein [Hyphomonadaceae bacterium]|nr:Ig-like domain-containing protein [Hyphomonadaceae bacterium]